MVLVAQLVVVVMVVPVVVAAVVIHLAWVGDMRYPAVSLAQLVLGLVLVQALGEVRDGSRAVHVGVVWAGRLQLHVAADDALVGADGLDEDERHGRDAAALAVRVHPLLQLLLPP